MTKVLSYLLGENPDRFSYKNPTHFKLIEKIIDLNRLFNVFLISLFKKNTFQMHTHTERHVRAALPSGTSERHIT